MSNPTASDPTPDTVDKLIPVLDAAEALAGAAALRGRTYDLLHLGVEAVAVDVGCGAGRAVAEMVDRGARSIGVDPNEKMIAVARARWPGADFRLGDAHALPLADREVTAYRADKVFHELDDPAGALGEARRVLAPGGRILLIGQDWDTFVIDSDDPALTREIVHARADTIANPRAARRYRSLLLDAGFQDAAVEVHTGVFTDATMLPLITGLASAAYAAGAITRDQADAWATEQTDRARTQRLFLAIPLFLASATRN